MGADARKAFIDRNVSVLKDVDAERKVLDEAERAKEAEQAKRVRNVLKSIALTAIGVPRSLRFFSIPLIVRLGLL